VDAEKLAELVGATLGGWSEERDAPLALSLVSPWLEAQLPVAQPLILAMIKGQCPLVLLFWPMKSADMMVMSIFP
jgi:hypothetical protein